MSLCGWTGAAGLPLIAMMPSDVTSATATLTGPTGADPHLPAPQGQRRRRHRPRHPRRRQRRRRHASHAARRRRVHRERGVERWQRRLVVHGRSQRTALGRTAPEPVTATTTSAAGAVAKFSPVAPFRFVDSRTGLRSTRLRANQVARIHVSDDPNVVAVSADFVSTGAAANGHLTLYNCTDEQAGREHAGLPARRRRGQPGIRAARGRRHVRLLVRPPPTWSST